MLADIASYKGREQSYIKHLFLNRYLEAAAYKILQGRSPKLTFVDAFAGPWRSSDTGHYSDTSFAQATDTLKTVQQALSGIRKSRFEVRFVFCERKPKSANKLRKFAAQKPDFRIEVFDGKFEDNLAAIEDVCSGGFAFTFIDPTGWNLESSKIFAFLQRLKGEFFFNFMAEEINRHAGWEGVQKSIGRFVSDPDWQEQFRRLPSDWKNEAKVIHILKQKMREAKTAKFLPEMAIQHPQRDRVKMRLILGTHNLAGVEVFRDTQKRVEQDAVLLREQIKNPNQPPLFPKEELVACATSRNGVGCASHMRRAESMVLEVVGEHPGIAFSKLAGMVMEDVPVRPPDIKKLVMAMRKSGSLQFDLDEGKRTPSDNTRIFLAE